MIFWIEKVPTAKGWEWEIWTDDGELEGVQQRKGWNFFLYRSGFKSERSVKAELEKIKKQFKIK